MRSRRPGVSSSSSSRRLASAGSLVLLLLACSGDPATTQATSGESESSGESEGGSSTTSESDSDATSETSAATTSTSTATSTSTSTATSTATTDPSESDSESGRPACPDGGLGPGDHSIGLMHDGMERAFNLHIPPGYDPTEPTPLVVNFHGLTSNAGQQALFSGMNPVADAEGFLVAYPEGHMNSWNGGACCGGAQSAGLDDVGFARALVAELQGLACIDDRRIFATGMSNGGFMTGRLACEASDLFAAFAPVSAVLVTEPCEPARPIPIMMFNGTLDTLVPYDGGLFASAPETFAGWAKRSGCTGEPVETYAMGAATCETYTTCEADVAVTLCTIDPMGHCWPGQDFCPFVPANSDISANQEMWEFFMAHPRP